MNAMKRALLSLLGAAALGACAARAPVADPFGGDVGVRPLRVEVRNNNFNDATIWANYQSERIRLGTVNGKSDANFSLRTRQAQPLYMEIDLVGGGRCVTDQITVDEGDTIYLEIAVDLSAMQRCY